MSELVERRLNSGPGKVLLAVYVLFAISAGARALYQIATQFSVAPLAYLLSAFSAAVYILAAVAIGRRQRRLALVAVWIELVGVIGIGLFTLLAPQDFADDTVWTDFGIGYGLFPLILPVLGLLWLFRSTDRS
ncbi:membrane protein [Hymenobacter humi]